MPDTGAPWALPYPELSDTADVPDWIQQLAEQAEAGLDALAAADTALAAADTALDARLDVLETAPAPLTVTATAPLTGTAAFTASLANWSVGAGSRLGHVGPIWWWILVATRSPTTSITPGAAESISPLALATITPAAPRPLVDFPLMGLSLTAGGKITTGGVVTLTNLGASGTSDVYNPGPLTLAGWFIAA